MGCGMRISGHDDHAGVNEPCLHHHLMAYTGIERTNRVTMELAKRALKDILTIASTKEITLPMIIDEAEAEVVSGSNDTDYFELVKKLRADANGKV